MGTPNNALEEKRKLRKQMNETGRMAVTHQVSADPTLYLCGALRSETVQGFACMVTCTACKAVGIKALEGK